MSDHDTYHELPDDHPLALVNSQIQGLLEGCGASEDHGNVRAFLRATGLPLGTVDRIHQAIVCAEKDPNRLEGWAPTEEERRENARKLDAMHPANRFRLMFGMPLLNEE